MGGYFNSSISGVTFAPEKEFFKLLFGVRVRVNSCLDFLISISLVTDLFYYKYGTFSLQLFVINLKPSTHHLLRLALLFAGGVIFVNLM